MDQEAKKAQALAGMQARQLEREKQKQTASLDQEATKTFLTWFANERQKVDSMIAQASLLEQGALPDHFLAISTELDLMQQRTAESTDILPSHDLAQSTNVIAEYQKNLQSVKTTLLPRPKFGFKSRAKAQEAQKQPQKGEAEAKSSSTRTASRTPDEVAVTFQRLAAETPVIEIAQLENQVC